MMKYLSVIVLSLAAATGGALAAEGKVAAPPEPSSAERYTAECGSCHMAYPARFLPARSWQTLMGDLANHFGDNAEVSDAARKEITRYLLAGAADRSQERKAAKFASSIAAGDTPLRITDVPYFKREHREIPLRYIRDNAKVGSLSNCTACHTQADQGSFSEREISIPGVGRWEDD